MMTLLEALGDGTPFVDDVWHRIILRFGVVSFFKGRNVSFRRESKGTCPTEPNYGRQKADETHLGTDGNNSGLRIF